MQLRGTAASALALSIILISSHIIESKPSVDPDLAVHAFYYLWYGTPEFDGDYSHWNHEVLPHWNEAVKEKFSHGERHNPPDSPHSPYYPLRGVYSSRDMAVLSDHIMELSHTNCHVLALSWWGPSWRDGAHDTQGSSTDALLGAVLAEVEAHPQMRVALHLEPYAARDLDSVREDVMYLTGQHHQSPALLRVEGRPVYYVYDSYRIPAEEWAQLLCPGGAKTIRGTDYDGIFLGLWLDHNDGQVQLLPGCFDGFYTYFASEATSYGANPDNWAELGRFARKHGLLFAPSVAPGYNDTRIRPWNSAHLRDREGGARYQRYWQAALEAGADIVSITSFNEWGEGTQIEAARHHMDPATGAEFASYGQDDAFKYMHLTAEYAMRFQQQLRVRDGVITPGLSSPEVDSHSKDEL